MEPILVQLFAACITTLCHIPYHPHCFCSCPLLLFRLFFLSFPPAICFPTADSFSTADFASVAPTPGLPASNLPPEAPSPVNICQDALPASAAAVPN